MIKDLKVTIIQSDIAWHDINKNLRAFDHKINAIKEETDLIILPEMFTTGFSMEAPKYAESMHGPSMIWMQQSAEKLNAAIMGSLIISEGGKYYNRLIWMNPDGTHHKYDKRHLFALAKEDEYYSAGYQKLILPFRGWNICPMVCYDLRFPVWSRNIDLEYDILIYIASWPNKRSYDWNTLLKARAIENQSYVIGVNRVGTDGNGHEYNGDSCVIDPGWRKTLFHQEKKEIIHTTTLSKKHLEQVRSKLPFSNDSDSFEIKNSSN